MGVAVAESILFIFILIYGGVLLFFLSFVLKWFRGKKEKRVAVTIILMVFIGPFFIMLYNTGKSDREKHKRMNSPARKLFEKRCLQAGEIVYKIVSNVEGVLLIDLRKKRQGDFMDINWPHAALPTEEFNDHYILSFLQAEFRNVRHALENRGHFSSNTLKKANDNIQYILFLGYSYVDVQEGDEFMRYTLNTEDSGKMFLKERISPKKVSRYALTFTNDVYPEDRIHWVAGTTVTITDTWNQEIIGQKTWHSFAIHQVHWPKSPDTIYNWLSAEICPKPKNSETSYHTRKFVDQVLQPKQEH